MVQLTKQILTQRFDALAGLLAAALALAVVELMAAVTGDVSLIVAVGNVVVDYTPGPIVKWAIDLLGTKDKPVLLATIVLISLLLGAGLGPAARRWPVVSVVAFALFGIGGAVAGAIDPMGSNLVFLSAALAAAVGWLAVRLLLDAATLEGSVFLALAGGGDPRARPREPAPLPGLLRGGARGHRPCDGNRSGLHRAGRRCRCTASRDHPPDPDPETDRPG